VHLSAHIRDAGYDEDPGSANGASRRLPSAVIKVCLLNRLPALDLGRGDYSSCPTAVTPLPGGQPSPLGWRAVVRLEAPKAALPSVRS
jgi:hypothetical protein